MALTPSLARLSLAARTGAKPTTRARTENDEDGRPAQFSAQLPPDLWRLIITLGADDNVCDNINELCNQMALAKGIGSCKDDSFFDEINARLGWYGDFASLEAVRAHFARPGNEVDWTVPETARAYFQTVCYAFRGVGTDLDLIERGKFVDLHEGRPYFASLAKRVVRIDPKALRHVPYVPEYFEIATVAVREEGGVLQSLLSNVLEYDEYVQLATIAVAQDPQLVDTAMNDWIYIITINVDELADDVFSKLATDLVIACMQSRDHDVEHLVSVMKVLSTINYGGERVDVPRVFREAVAFCATEHAARVRAFERLEASDDANARERWAAVVGQVAAARVIGALAVLTSADRLEHEDAYRAAVVEAAKNFDILRMWIDRDCPVVEYIDPWYTPQYVRMLKYIATDGDAADLEHVTSGPGAYLSVDQHYSLAQMAVTHQRPPYEYLDIFLHTEQFTCEQITDLAILTMSTVRSTPKGLWPNPKTFLQWFMADWDSATQTELDNLDELPYDLVRIFDAAVVQIGTEANKTIPSGPQAFERATTRFGVSPSREIKTNRTNWLHAQYDQILFFARCHDRCLQKVLHRMAIDFNQSMLLLGNIDFTTICYQAVFTDNFATKLEEISPSAPPDVARDGVVAYPGFEYPGYVARVREKGNVRWVWKIRHRWLKELQEWSQKLAPPPAPWRVPPPQHPHDE